MFTDQQWMDSRKLSKDLAVDFSFKVLQALGKHKTLSADHTAAQITMTSKLILVSSVKSIGESAPDQEAMERAIQLAETIAGEFQSLADKFKASKDELKHEAPHADGESPLDELMAKFKTQWGDKG